jgi:predicted RNA-binding protein YlqC (UPF0109 family)
MSSTIDQQFIEYVVKSIVSHPDAVQVDRRVDEKGVLLELSVDPEDLGRVIGKRGATAQSLRTLLRALGTKNEARYNLKIIDTGEGAPAPASSVPASDDASDDVVTRADDSAAAPADHPQPAVTDDQVEPEEKALPPAHEPSDVVSKTRRELEDLDDLDI